MEANYQIPIGRFSILTRISQKNLRLYDEQEILIPEFKDIGTGYRYYNATQLSNALKINILKQTGFSTIEIKEIMNLLRLKDGDKNLIESLIQKKVDQLKLKIKNLQTITSILQRSKTLEELLKTVSKVEIKETKDIRVLAKRELGTYGETVGKLIDEMLIQINRRENNPALIKINGPIMTIYHDKEYKEQGADIEVAIPVVGRIVVDEDYELKKIPGMKVASILHTGPYNEIGIAWDQMMQYIEKNQLQILGNPREVYLNDPKHVPESQLLTEIQIPISRETGT
jgi:effector-binding domain-containing protein